MASPLWTEFLSRSNFELAVARLIRGGNRDYKSFFRACLKSASGETAKHEPDHGDVDHRLAGIGEVLVVFAQAALTAEPAEGSLHDPPTWQHLETFDVVGTLHDLETDWVSFPERPDPGDQLPSVATVGPDEA
jgi:hypothetical protein